MSALLTDPAVVLVVTKLDERWEEVQSATLSGEASSVANVGSAIAARNRLADSHDVGCAVVTDTVSNESVPEVCRTIRDEKPLLPIIVYASAGDETLAHEATRAGATYYVPTDAAGSVLREIVDEAIKTYKNRREQAEESSILYSMFEEIGVSMFAKDRKGRHVRASKVPGGYSPEQVKGKTDIDIYAEEDPQMAREAYEDDMQVIQDEKAIYEKDELSEQDAGEYWARTTKVPWRGPDESVKGLVGLSIDITDEVKQERRLEQQAERIEQFARYVSHDLRSPLQVATGALELAKENCEDDAIDTATEALERIDGILEDLTTLAKEEKETVSFNSESPDKAEFARGVPIVDVVEQVWEVVKTDAADLIVEFEDQAIINAPETSVRPIFENLFKNAIDHGGEDVSIRVGPLADGGFYVSDDGPGIPEDLREKVTDEGFTTSESGSGTGLGIVSETVAKHEWGLNITDSEADGARIEIENCLLVPLPDRGLESEEALELTDQVDVGPIELKGSANYDEVRDRWSVSGAGSNIWRQENEFHFVYTPVEGPVRLQTRIVELEDLSEYSKAGVMVRSGLEDNASYGYIGITPRHGTEILWRTQPGGNGISQHLEEEALTYPWYRVDRVDQTVTTWLSPNGDTWHPVDQREVALDEPVHVGLVVCSFTPRRLCEATFSDVTVERLSRE